MTFGVDGVMPPIFLHRLSWFFYWFLRDSHAARWISQVATSDRR